MTDPRIALVAVLLLVGCTKEPSSSSSGNSSTPSSTVSARVTPDDGGVVGGEAGARVTVPPGAVEHEVRIRVAPKRAEDYRSAGTRVVGTVWSFDVDGQEHFTFAKPVRLSLPFDPARMRATLSVWQDGRWEKVPGARAENDRIVADVSHFSDYACTEDEAPAVSGDLRKRFIENQFWYARVDLTTRGAGRNFSIAREAHIKFRLRVDPAEVATMAGFDELKKRGVKLPMGGETHADVLRTLRVWNYQEANRAPEDEIDLDWSVNDRWEDPTVLKTVTGHYTGKVTPPPRLPMLFIDIVKGTYEVAVALHAGTVTTTEKRKGEEPVSKTAPGEVTWTRSGKLPSEGNVLADHEAGPNSPGNIGDGGVSFSHGSIQSTMTCSLSPEPLEDLELVVRIADYDTWLPGGTLDGSGPGNRLAVDAELRRQGGGRPKEGCEEIIFRLDSSSAPGVACNAPVQTLAKPKTDLVIDEGGGLEIRSDGLEAKARKRHTARAIVSCWDFGAWGTLRVAARTSLGRWFFGRLVSDTQSYAPTYDILLPRRSKGSMIADEWKVKAGVALETPDDEDTDAEPKGDGFAGDGLTLYEEYRGFVIQEDKGGPKHLRTDPKKKDLFVCVSEIDVKDALEKLETVSKLVVHRVREELHQNRQINFNAPREVKQRCKQHLVRLTRQNLVDKVMHPIAGGALELLAAFKSRRPQPITPRHVDRVWIGDKSSDVGVAIRAFDGKLRTEGVEPYFVVAAVHELLHAVGVGHHGADHFTPVTWTRQGNRVLEDGKPITVYREGSTTPMSPDDVAAYIAEEAGVIVVAEKGDAFSGDQACVMRYAGADALKGADGRRIIIPRDETWGLELCTSKSGSGVNAPPLARYGDATFGNCAAQIRVSDAGK